MTSITGSFIEIYIPEQDRIIRQFEPLAISSLDDLPPELSTRNYENTLFVPPVLYFGFEIPDETQYPLVFAHFKAIRTEYVYGLHGKIHELIILDSNGKRMEPEPEEGVKEVQKILGPPKLYISFQHPVWIRRRHYSYGGEMFVPSIPQWILTVCSRLLVTSLRCSLCGTHL